MPLEQWTFQLGNLHQFRGVPYVEVTSSGTACCKLCGTGWMSKSQKALHFHGSRHATMYNRVKKLEEAELHRRRTADRVDEMNRLDKRVKTLGLKSWRDIVYASMFQYCSLGGDIDVVLKKLAVYERMEVSSLLELAVWENYIVGDGLLFASVAEMREYQILEEDFDPREFAAKLRVSSGVEVIIPRVLDFLGPEICPAT